MGVRSSKSSLEMSGHNLALQLQQAKKQMAGVGLIFRRDDNGSLVVKEIVKGSSAEQCGSIQSGDILCQVERTKISKLTLDDISAMILGNPGDKVHLSFIRPGAGMRKKNFSVSLQRTVHASPQPTYILQKEGANTVVTAVHLNCLQNQSSLDALSPQKQGLQPAITEATTPADRAPLAAFAEICSSSSSCSTQGGGGQEEDEELAPASLLPWPSTPDGGAQRGQSVQRALFAEEGDGQAQREEMGGQEEEGLQLEGLQLEDEDEDGGGEAAAAPSPEPAHQNGGELPAEPLEQERASEAVRPGLAKELARRLERQLQQAADAPSPRPATPGGGCKAMATAAPPLWAAPLVPAAHE